MKKNWVPSSFLRLLFPWRSVLLVEQQMAGQIASECRAALWHRVQRATANMSMAEVRGYLRAQAAECVAAEIDRVVRHGRLQPVLSQGVMEAAIDQLVAAVAHDVFSEQPHMAAMPMAA